LVPSLFRQLLFSVFICYLSKLGNKCIISLLILGGMGILKKQKQKNHPRQTSGKKNSLKNMVSIKRDRGKSKITLEQLISLMVIELGLSIDDKNDIKEVCQKLIDL